MDNPLILETINFGDLDWGDKVNRNFLAIDIHNHVDYNQGNDIEWDFVTIVSDIVGLRNHTFEGNFRPFFFLYNATFLDFVNRTEDIFEKNTIYVKNEELFYTNSSRFPVQITINGAINVTVIGGGGFVGLQAGANVLYDSVGDFYHFFGDSGGECSVKAKTFNAGTNTSTTTDAPRFNFTQLTFSNIAPLANGTFLLFEGNAYSPSLTAVNINLFAQNKNDAKAKIAQVNGLQAIVERTYETKIFSFDNAILLTNTTFLHLTKPNAFDSGSPSYTISTVGSNKKGNNLFFSIYSRLVSNLPAIVSFPNATTTVFTIANTLSTSKLQPLSTIRRTA